MKVIELNGKSYRMAYNLQVAITFERMTGKNPLAFDQFEGGGMETMCTIAYCMLLANNDAKDVPDWDDFVRSITDVQTLADVLTAASEEMTAFFAESKGDRQEWKQDEEDQSKNV